MLAMLDCRPTVPSTGDMWDKRGDLPVHVLNRLLVEFKLWEKVPTIMLVGNHDQVQCMW